MPLSESEKELLLSAALDGALSPDEQAMLDQWFQEDPSALRQYEEMAEVRAQLRTALAPLRQAKLGERFAQRVVEAAIQQAQTENLSANHPLVRLAGPTASATETTATGRAGSAAAWRWAAVGGVLAASLLLALSWGRPWRDAPVDPQELAQADPNELRSADPAIEELAADNRSGDGDAAAVVDPATPEVPGGRAESEPATPSALAGGPQTGTPRRPSAATSAGEQTELESPPPAPATMLAESAPAVPVPPSDAEDQSASQRVPLVAVLVVSVELTQEGRDSLALLQALRAADIQLGPAGAVEEQVVAQLRQSQVIETTAGASSAKLYYIEAPAKQLDRFLLRLMADKSSFASFGFSIADSPGVLASVADWREVDPTTLRHADTQGLARDLVAADGTPLAIDQGPAFVPMPREMGTAGLLTPAADTSSGEDVDSQILLLIR